MPESLFLTEQLTFRVPKSVMEIIDEQCFKSIDGQRVRVQNASTLARELFLRGLQQYLEEKKMVEEYKKVQQVQQLQEQ